MTKKPHLTEKGKEIEYFQEKKNTYIRKFRDETEFNILVSQAANLAEADFAVGLITDYGIEKRIDFWFDLLLKKRADKNLIKKFDDFKLNQATEKQKEQDRLDEQKNDAELDANQDHIDEVKPEEL